jgi:hypothetical protein
VDPDVLRAWQTIFRDFVIVLLAAFMLIYETVWVTPNAYIVGAGLTLLGIPPALRLDRRRRDKKHGGDDDDDPYDGPGGYYRGQ